MTRAERYVQFRILRDQGLVYREIAERTGVATSTVHDILMDPTGEKALARKSKRFALCKDCGTKVSNSGSKPPERCRDCQLQHQRTMEFRETLVTPRARKYSDEKIAEVLRAHATDGVLSLPIYNAAYDRAPRGSMPSVPLLSMRYGSWGEALEHAGLRPPNGRRGPYKTRLTKDGALCAVCDCAAAISKVPTYREYEEWARETGSPSAMLVRLRWDGWWNAVEACRAAMPELADVAA